MKKILSIAVLLLAFCILFGCGKAENTVPSQTENNPVEKTNRPQETPSASESGDKALEEHSTDKPNEEEPPEPSEEESTVPDTYGVRYEEIIPNEATAEDPNSEEIFEEPVEEINYPISNGEWDEILLNCDNMYFLVLKETDTYNSHKTEIGVVSKDNEWLYPLSDENSLIDFLAVHSKEHDPPDIKDCLYYLGGGVIVGSIGVDVCTTLGRIPVGKGALLNGAQCYFLNFMSLADFTYGTHVYGYNQSAHSKYDNKIVTIYPVVSDGYDSYIILKTVHGWSYRISCDWSAQRSIFTDNGLLSGHKVDVYRHGTYLYSEYEIYLYSEYEYDFSGVRNALIASGPYSDGVLLFRYDGFDPGYVFCDIDGSMVLDMSEYDLVDPSSVFFVNGECEFSFKNPVGNIYTATIDKEGNFVVEPHIADN